MTTSVPWQQRLSTGTENIQSEVVSLYQQTRHSKAYVPDMIWGTLQTEAYATVILRKVVAFLESRTMCRRAWPSAWSDSRSCTTASITTTLSSGSSPCTRTSGVLR